MDSNTYQPPTRNPQQNAAGGLQPNSPGLQPVENQNGSELNPNALPKTDNLQVTEQNEAARTIQVQTLPANAPPPGGGTSLWVFSVATFIFALILLAMAKVAKPAAQVKSTGASQETAKRSVQKDKVITTKAKKTNQKSKKSKRNAKRKKKK